MKLDRKQVLNALHQIRVFRDDRSSKVASDLRKSNMAVLSSDWLKHYSTSSPQPLNIFCRNLTGSKSSMPSIKFVFFRADQKTKMVAPYSDLLRHFSSSSPQPLNRFWKKNWQEASPRCPLSSLSCRSEIQDGRSVLWLVRHFLSSSPQPLNGLFWRNLTGSKSSMPSIESVFFMPIGNSRWLPWPLIGLSSFNLFSSTSLWILTKLDSTQVLNALFQVCVFRADRKSKMAALASDSLKHFSSSTPQPLDGIWRNLTGSKSSTSSTKFVFFVPICHPRWLPWPLIGWNIFRLLRIRWKDFDDTWLEASPQRNLSILCFSWWSVIQGGLWFAEIQYGRPVLWLAETLFDFISTTTEYILSKLDRKQVLNALHQVCVFRADRKSKIVALYSDLLRHFSSSSPQPLNRFWKKLDRKQVLNIFYRVCVFHADRKSKFAAIASDCL